MSVIRLLLLLSVIRLLLLLAIVCFNHLARLSVTLLAL
jgi:hypothetical protein